MCDEIPLSTFPSAHADNLLEFPNIIGNPYTWGNEVADQYAKDAATGRAPRERLPEGYAEETSLAHMTRVATGPIQGNDRLDCGARAIRTTLQTTSWEGR